MDWLGGGVARGWNGEGMDGVVKVVRVWNGKVVEV